MSAIQTPEPRAMWLRTWVISIFLASAYSALGHWIDLIILPVILLICAAFGLMPIVGAIIGPRWITAFRRWAAEHEANCARR